MCYMHSASAMSHMPEIQEAKGQMLGKIVMTTEEKKVKSEPLCVLKDQGIKEQIERALLEVRLF